MTAIEIVAKYIKENGALGLFNTENECSCWAGNLFSCCDFLGDCTCLNACVVGYKTDCDEGEKCECKQYDEGEYCHMTPDAPSKKSNLDLKADRS